MSAIFSLLGFITAVLLGSALLCWPVHQLLGLVTDYPFHKLLGHLTLVLGLAGSFVYLSLNGMLDRRGCGYGTGKKPFLKQVGIGLLIGNLVLLVIELLLLVLGLHVPEPGLTPGVSWIIELVFIAAVTGLVVGLTEETIFRGAIQGVLMKHLKVIPAVLLSSFAYAALHFIKFPELPANIDPDWHSGLSLLADSFKYGYFTYNFDKFITLLLLGVLLGTLRAINGNIALCIGVHAGLVMMMKISRKLTDYVPGSELDFLVNYTDHQLGWLSTFILAIVVIGYILIHTKGDKR
ncbi:MAG: CPBP family intramembrane glutamic endopeptidase [Gammaproteobacteria bacterium]|nr:CPBP family intramembrane glutamic endopeptidase [Gammaproteobacteria bacterium]